MTKSDHGSVVSVLFSKPFLGILLLFTIVSLLNIPVLITLWRHGFDDGTYSHAFLIPFISLYLYYILAQTDKLQFRTKLAIAPTALLMISCYLLFVTTNAQISVGYWGALLAVFITSVTMMYRFNWYIIFPVAFLIFIFPFWAVLVPLLQSISVTAVTYMMSFTGIPTFVEGQLITIPAGVFEIAGGCSGLRYIIVSLAIGSLFIFLNIKDTKKSILFLSMTILGALLTNWIRITALILIGEYTNMESSLMEDHNTFGWYLFIPFMIILFWWGNKNADFDLTAPQSKPHSEATIHSNKTQIEDIPSKLLLSVFILMLALSSTGFRTMLILSPPEKHLASDSSFKVKPDIHFYSIVSHNASSKDNSTQLTYFFNGEDLDGKPTYYENDLTPNGWRALSDEISSSWRVIVVTKGQNKALVLTRYEIDGELIVAKRKFKLTRLIKAVKNINRTKLHWSFSPCSTDCYDELQNL